MAAEGRAANAVRIQIVTMASASLPVHRVAQEKNVGATAVVASAVTDVWNHKTAPREELVSMPVSPIAVKARCVEMMAAAGTVAPVSAGTASKEPVWKRHRRPPPMRRFGLSSSNTAGDATRPAVPVAPVWGIATLIKPMRTPRKSRTR